MGDDLIENIRRQMAKEINSNAGERAELKQRHGQVWDTQELGNDFEVLGFLAPFVVVKRKADGAIGSLEFQHAPRYYFNFQLKK